MPLKQMLDLSALNAGKPHAFRYVYERYYKSLCLFASKFIGHDDAEDVVDDVFLTIWKKGEQFDNEGHLKSFLYLSVKNACLNTLKAAQRTGERQYQFVFERGEIEESYLVEVMRAELLRELGEAVTGLPPQCRKVINLTYLEGKSNQEVAAELNLSVHTVKNQKQRGLSLLREKLADHKEYLILLLPLLYLPF